MSRAEPLDEGIGPSPPAVQLERQIEAFCAHGVEERIERRRIFPGVFRGTDSPSRGQLDDPIDGPRSPGQIGPVPPFSEQHDFSRRKGRTKRLESRKTEDVVADAIGTKHSDLANLAETRHGFIPFSNALSILLLRHHDGGARTVSGTPPARSRLRPENDLQTYGAA